MTRPSGPAAKRAAPKPKPKPATTPAPAPADKRAARGSVTEAIGKLIGDDGACERGAAEKSGGAATGPTHPKDR